jgi:hypothetical protein
MIRYLLWGLSSLHLVVAIAGFSATAEFDRYHGQAAALAVVLFSVVELVVALVFATLAVLRARIVTWVVGGLTLALSVPVAAADVYDAAPWFGRLIVVITIAGAVLTVSASVFLALPSPRSPRSGKLPGNSPSHGPSRRLLPGNFRDLGRGVAMVVGIALAVTAGGSARPVAYAKPKPVRYLEPPHEVVYLYTVPAAKREDRFIITYLDRSGRKETITQPGFPPAWVELIRLPPGATALELFVRSSETSSAPMIQCSIQVDGRVVRSSDGNPCRVRLTFPLKQQE